METRGGAVAASRVLRLTVARLTGLCLAAGASGLGCTHWVPYAGDTEVAASAPPEVLYAAAVRVLLKHGWGFQSRDPVAHAVETSWIKYPGMNGAALSHRIIVTGSRVQIFSSCRRNDFGEKCGDRERPEGTRELENQLLAEIAVEARTIASSEGGVPAAAAPSKPAPAVRVECVGVCGRDRDSCQKGCGKATRCLEGCGSGYESCLKACGG